jgi:hypothetical protein
VRKTKGGQLPKESTIERRSQEKEVLKPKKKLWKSFCASPSLRASGANRGKAP